jgi:tetratricopeptide (TPR) repeat protein
MRPTSKLAALLFGAAAFIAGEGLVTRDGVDPSPAAPGRETSTLLDPAEQPGLRSTDEIVALWSDRAMADPQDYLSRTQLGSALLRQARETGDLSLYEDAREAFDDALRLNGRHAAALLGLGSAEAANHDFAVQLELARKALAVAPGSLQALAAIGDARFELGDYGGATTAFHALAVDERSAPVLSRLARLAHVEGRVTDAVSLMTEAVSGAVTLDLPPQTAAQYLFQLGHYRYEAGEVAGAAASLEDALAIAPDHLGSLELLAQVRVAQERIDVAIEIYEELIARGPAADLHGSAAALYSERGDSVAARRHLDAGLALGLMSIDRYPAERRHLAGFFARHDPALALVLAGEDLATRRDVYAYDLYAWALYRNGRYDEADAAARNALATGIRDVEVLYHAGMIAAAVGDADGARGLLSDALDINPRFDVVDAPEAAAMLERLRPREVGGAER